MAAAITHPEAQVRAERAAAGKQLRRQVIRKASASTTRKTWAWEALCRAGTSSNTPIASVPALRRVR
jgi:hypothetical protein